MATDPRTMLFLTLALALVASTFLALEWRAVRETALAYWSAGFAAITLGCSLSPLREGYSFLIGIWFANTMVPLAHLLFLYGVAQFVGRRVTRLWWALLLGEVIVLLSGYADHVAVLGMLNTALVALIVLRTAHLLFVSQKSPDMTAKQLGVVFLLHGGWYAIKTALILVPGAYVDVSVYKGFAIRVSFFEGVVVVLLLTLLMAAAVRRRREKTAEILSELDPLTGALNRRGFERQAGRVLRHSAKVGSPSALLLLDLDGFKAINDSAGHAYGDQILVVFTRTVEAVLPRAAILARLGGDEFAVLVCDIDAKQVADLSEAIRARFASVGAAAQPSLQAATVSVGAVTFEGAAELADVLDTADASLYRAKRTGRDRFCVHHLGASRVPSPARGERMRDAHRSELQPH